MLIVASSGTSRVIAQAQAKPRMLLLAPPMELLTNRGAAAPV
jgi:hypothetical protein